MSECHKNLTDEEIERNTHGPMLQYDYVPENQGSCEGPGNEKIHAVYARETLVERADIHVPSDRMVLKMSEKTLKGVHFPGFPTTKHLQYTSKLEMARVKVFEQPSMNESMIIHLNSQSNNLDQNIKDLARKLVGKEVFIGWPHLVEAKVTAVSNEMLGITSDSDDDDEEAIFEKNFFKYKRAYYINKLKYPDMTEDVLKEQTYCYISALQWTLFYYYRGIVSWGWFYPHHYAPFVSDLKNFRGMKLKFEMGRPFLPFEQLLAVLPSASKSHLPPAYQGLMTDPRSDIIDYYPTEFETDLNGKRIRQWEL
uniref:Xrn1 helical domain-containing protein n=1 Tax=Phlebotomus papatasi TaxID=29031 RepID=A0A1B0DDG6_PHLPP